MFCTSVETCRPEATPKDLGIGREDSLGRRPDPSLRCASFRMTEPAHVSIPIRMIRSGGRQVHRQDHLENLEFVVCSSGHIFVRSVPVRAYIFPAWEEDNALRRHYEHAPGAWDAISTGGLSQSPKGCAIHGTALFRSGGSPPRYKRYQHYREILFLIAGRDRPYESIGDSIEICL